MTSPLEVFMTPPHETMGRSVSWWLSIPVTFIFRDSSIAMTRMSEPHNPPFAPRSISDPKSIREVAAEQTEYPAG